MVRFGIFSSPTRVLETTICHGKTAALSSPNCGAPKMDKGRYYSTIVDHGECGGGERNYGAAFPRQVSTRTPPR